MVSLDSVCKRTNRLQRNWEIFFSELQNASEARLENWNVAFGGIGFSSFEKLLVTTEQKREQFFIELNIKLQSSKFTA